MRTCHELKTVPPFFGDVFCGRKTFEVRKNDRNYQTGDTLLLREFMPEIQEYTGDELIIDVTYVMQGGQHGIADGYCVLGIRNVREGE